MGSLKRYLLLFSFLISVLFCSPGFSKESSKAEGLIWDRVRLMPALTLSEIYSDNIFLTPADHRTDFITAVDPKASLDFALAPQNIISLRYRGDFRFYEKSDNFQKYAYQSGASWAWTAPKGSTFKIDAGEDHNSIQPYSATDTYKEYVERKAFADAVLKSLLFVDLGFRYDHASRRYADSLYSLDDFNRDSATVNATYWALPVTGILLEYTYSRQNNYNLPVSQTLDTQEIMTGVRWDPTAKLSGHLKVGYYYTSLEGSANPNGFDIDTDLAYQASDFTRLSLVAFRRLVRSTLVDRETGQFYISAGGAVSASYSGWDPITMTMDISYANNRFSQIGNLPGGERADDYIDAGLGARYSLKDWLSFMMNYRYRVNDSNYSAYGYRESRVEVRLSLAI